ncbi:hypothetical protein J6590_070314 [Homalodisca vitripennis]|nr:hypothetical protein J6590_070314 [Homalodisca vitripennis]
MQQRPIDCVTLSSNIAAADVCLRTVKLVNNAATYANAGRQPISKQLMFNYSYPSSEWRVRALTGQSADRATVIRSDPARCRERSSQVESWSFKEKVYRSKLKFSSSNPIVDI